MVHTRPGIPTLVALWMKEKYSIHFLNDVRGFWADERVDGGMWNLRNPLFRAIYHFFKKHETECLKKADSITCLTHAAKKEIHSWKDIPGQPLPIRVIPCSTDLDLFNPVNIDSSLKEYYSKLLNIQKEDIIFSYLGSIGGWYLTAEMMKFCKMVSDKIPAARFLFISPHRHGQIIQAAAISGLPADKIITTHAKRHEVPVLLSFSTYAVFFIKPCYSKISSSPTKHGEIMAMGIPVITNSGVGDVKEIIEQYNSGFVLEDLSETSMAAVIDKIIMNPSFENEKIRNGAAAFYSLGDAVESYRAAYVEVLGE